MQTGSDSVTRKGFLLAVPSSGVRVQPFMWELSGEMISPLAILLVLALSSIDSLCGQPGQVFGQIHRSSHLASFWQCHRRSTARYRADLVGVHTDSYAWMDLSLMMPWSASSPPPLFWALALPRNCWWLYFVTIPAIHPTFRQHYRLSLVQKLCARNEGRAAIN